MMSSYLLDTALVILRGKEESAFPVLSYWFFALNHTKIGTVGMPRRGGCTGLSLRASILQMSSESAENRKGGHSQIRSSRAETRESRLRLDHEIQPECRRRELRRSRTRNVRCVFPERFF